VTISEMLMNQCREEEGLRTDGLPTARFVGQIIG
jgi:hypothetical protein